MTDINDFSLLMMTRGVAPASSVSSMLKSGIKFQAWTTWMALGFSPSGRLTLVDFDAANGFDLHLGDVSADVLVISDGTKLVAQVSPETFDENAAIISTQLRGCDNEECGCDEALIPVDLEIIEELRAPELESGEEVSTSDR